MLATLSENLWILGPVGIVIGFFTGLLGVGGGWLLTPLLNILGFPAAMAVGTSLSQMVVSTAIGGFTHLRAGRVIVKLALVLSVPMIIGVLVGKQVTTTFTKMNQADEILKVLHFSLTAFLGLTTLKSAFTKQHIRKVSYRAWLDKIPGPRFTIHGNPSPLFVPFFGALFAGVASGVMGIGGGILLFPLLVYLMEIDASEAVATNLVAMIAGAGIGTISYGMAGSVNFEAALFLILGASAGSFWGARWMKYAPANTIKLVFAVVLCATSISISFSFFELDSLARASIFYSAGFAFLMALFLVIRNKIRDV